jgi:hypothetical protein
MVVVEVNYHVCTVFVVDLSLVGVRVLKGSYVESSTHRVTFVG